MIGSTEGKNVVIDGRRVIKGCQYRPVFSDYILVVVEASWVLEFE